MPKSSFKVAKFWSLWVITIFLSAQFYKFHAPELEIISNKSYAEVYVLEGISAITIFFLKEKCLVLILNYTKILKTWTQL